MPTCKAFLLWICTIKKPLPMWLSASVFVTATVMIPLVYRSQHRLTDPPHSLKEFTELLAQVEPALHIAPATPHCANRGVWVSERPLCEYNAVRLLRAAECADRWQGIVLCEKPFEHFVTLEEVRESWGEYGMQIGPIQCFGDPALLRRIHKAMAGKNGLNNSAKHTIATDE